METQQNNQPIPIPPPASSKSQLPGAGKLFSQTWNLYKNNFWLLLGIYLAPFSLVAIGLILYYGTKSAGINLGGTFIILGIVGLVVLIYLTLWSTAALIQAAEIIVDNIEKVSFSESFSKSRKKIWALFGATLLSGLAVLGGTILLIIPGLIFFTWFSLSGYVVVAEGVSETKSLGVSKNYVKGRVGNVMWRWIFLGIIYLVTIIILAIILNFFPLQQNVAVLIMRITMAVFWTPFATLYGYLLYNFLKKNPA